MTDDSRSFKAALKEIPWWMWLSVGLLSALVGAAVYVVLAVPDKDRIIAALCMAAVTFIILIPIPALTLEKFKEKLPLPGKQSPYALVVPFLTYLLFAFGTGVQTLPGVGWWAVAVIFVQLLSVALLAVFIPFLPESGVGRNADPSSIWIIVIAVILFFPFFPMFLIDGTVQRLLPYIWQPAILQATHSSITVLGFTSEVSGIGVGVGYALASFFALDCALILFLWARPIGIRYDFRFPKDGLLLDLKFLALILLILAPLGIASGFLCKDCGAKPTPNLFAIFTFFIGNYISVALVEEVFFRGILQNTLQKRISTDQGYAALFITAFIFGLGHAFTKSVGEIDGNYVMLAAIIGAAYGYVWMRSNLFVAAIFHSSIDTFMDKILWCKSFPVCKAFYCIF